MVFYQYNNVDKFAMHYHWFLSNAPEHELLRDSLGRWDEKKDKYYKRIKKQWVELLDLPGVQPKTLSNAANFFAWADPKLAISYLEAAKRIDPWNTAWQFELVELYQNYSNFVGTNTCKKLLEKAIDCSEFLLRRKISNIDKVDIIDNIAGIALNAKQFVLAETYAKKLVELELIPEPNYNHSRALHRSKILQAEVALEKGFVDAACHHLIESAKIPISSIFMTFGPDFHLAEKLFVIGKKKEVLKYLELCRKFYDRVELLDNWISLIKSGKRPSFYDAVESEI